MDCCVLDTLDCQIKKKIIQISLTLHELFHASFLVIQVIIIICVSSVISVFRTFSLF